MPRVAMTGCIVATALLLLVWSGASGQTYQYAPPPKIGDGWETGSVTDEHLDAAKITAMLERVRDGTHPNIQSVLVVRNGKLLVEEYFPRKEGDRREQALRRSSPVELTSATKSVTSLLIGVAIDQHLIKSADEKVATFFPEFGDIFKDPAKAKLRVADLLSMTAGLSWDEWTRPYSDPLNDHVAMIKSDDPLRYVFERPVVASPGEKFAYNSGLSIALGQIIYKATGMRADKFAERNLFEPLGITDFYWMKWPEEIIQTGGGIYLRPRDMARLGQLVLDRGRWGSKQIISAVWLDDSMKKHVDGGRIPPAVHADGYGYQWWLSNLGDDKHPMPSLSARGRGGQFIIVMPEQKMVIVFTCATENPRTFEPLEIVRDEILPAIKSH